PREATRAASDASTYPLRGRAGRAGRGRAPGTDAARPAGASRSAVSACRRRPGRSATDRASGPRGFVPRRTRAGCAVRRRHERACAGTGGADAFQVPGPAGAAQLRGPHGGGALMGLFTGLLTLPLAPVRGTVWIAEQLAAEAERELRDERSVRRRLA